jgi:hypothetical protein
MVGRRLALRLGAFRKSKPAEDLPLFAPPGRKGRTRPQLPALSEAKLHATIAEWLDWFLLPPALYTTFPAGWGKLSKATGARLYRSGMKAGMPDLFIFHQKTCFGIELKPRGRYQSAVQRDMSQKLKAAGIAVYIAHDVDEVMDILKHRNCPLRSGWASHHPRTPQLLEKSP